MGAYPSHGGEGTSAFVMEIKLPTPEMHLMEAMMLLKSGQDVENVTTMNTTTTAQPVFYGMKQGASRDADSVCGFAVRDILNATGQRKLGPSRCAPNMAG